MRMQSAYGMDYGEIVSPIITEFVENLTPELQDWFNERIRSFQSRTVSNPVYFKTAS